jgi:hypothetical protein
MDPQRAQHAADITLRHHMRCGRVVGAGPGFPQAAFQFHKRWNQVELSAQPIGASVRTSHTKQLPNRHRDQQQRYDCRVYNVVSLAIACLAFSSSTSRHSRQANHT